LFGETRLRALELFGSSRSQDASRATLRRTRYCCASKRFCRTAKGVALAEGYSILYAARIDGVAHRTSAAESDLAENGLPNVFAQTGALRADGGFAFLTEICPRFRTLFVTLHVARELFGRSTRKCRATSDARRIVFNFEEADAQD